MRVNEKQNIEEEKGIVRARKGKYNWERRK